MLQPDKQIEPSKFLNHAALKNKFLSVENKNENVRWWKSGFFPPDLWCGTVSRCHAGLLGPPIVVVGFAIAVYFLLTLDSAEPSRATRYTGIVIAIFGLTFSSFACIYASDLPHELDEIPRGRQRNEIQFHRAGRWLQILKIFPKPENQFTNRCARACSSLTNACVTGESFPHHNTPNVTGSKPGKGRARSSGESLLFGI